MSGAYRIAANSANAELLLLLESHPPIRTVADLAARCYCTAATVARRFRRAGLPHPSCVVMAVRLARTIPDVGRMTYEAIAHAHGFPDPYTYSNAMRRVFGVRPIALQGRDPDDVLGLYVLGEAVHGQEAAA